jgi:hypothetical protein
LRKELGYADYLGALQRFGSALITIRVYSICLAFWWTTRLPTESIQARLR